LNDNSILYAKTTFQEDFIDSFDN